MKIIKTEYRNKLSSDALTEIMRIKFHSSEIGSFDPTPAIHLWNASNRRPCFLDKKTSTVPDDNTVQELSDNSSSPSSSDSEFE